MPACTSASMLVILATGRFVTANDGPMLFWGIGPLVVVVVVVIERTD